MERYSLTGEAFLLPFRQHSFYYYINYAFVDVLASHSLDLLSVSSEGSQLIEMADNATYNGMILPLDIEGLPDTHHTTSPTTISFVPSEAPTLSGGGGSTFSTGKGAHLDRLPESGPSPRAGDLIHPPNITVPQTHTSRTLVLCFDGTGDQ
jgi:hypothetical protein